MAKETTRRDFLSGAVAAGVLATGGPRLARAAEPAAEPPKTRMHLGLVTYMIGAQMDLPTLIKTCEDAGIEGLELRTTHRHGVEPTLDAAGRARIKDLFAKTQVRLVALGSICEYHSPKPEEVKRNIDLTRAFVQLAVDVGARGVKVRPNALPKEVPEETTLKQIGAALAECGPFAQEKGIELWVEVHGGGTALPPRMRQIMEACKHPAVGLCWNSNGSDLKDGSVREYFELLRPWIRHAHINDLRGRYPYRELFTLLKAMPYDRFTMIEIGSQQKDPVAYLREYRALWETMAL